MVAPITKAAWLVEDPDQIPDLVARAFDIATSGRPGPVLLDIPMDVQRAEVRSRPSGSPQTPRSPDDGVSPAIDGVHVDEMLSTLGRARRPLVLVGGGVRAGSAVAGVRRLVGSLGVPVVNSLMGVDVLPATDPLRVGMIGTYGNRWANIALARADWLLVLGSRLDIRQTGADVNAFREGKTIFHVDCDPGEINGRISGCIAVVRDLASFVEEVTPHVVGLESHGEWLHEIRALREQWPDTAEAVGGAGINPNELMHQLSAAAGEAAAFVADVGQHQMWAAQSLELGDGQRFITSGGLGSMGFGLPAAIGASFAMAGCPIVVIAGDGGFQLNIQELQTVVRNSLPLKIVILNNGTHGMVRQFQETYFHGRYQSTVWGYSAPDFAAVAGAYGIWARRVARTDEVDDCMRELMAVPGPALLEVAVPLETNVYPKMAFGRPMSEMEPFASPIAMEGT